jgi:Domain of unknown function (DUF5134)
MTPGWILDIAAALMLAVAAVSAARLVAARPWQRGSVITDTDVAHLLMAIAMAGMLVSSLATLPDAAWEVVFGVMTAWFGYRVIEDARANGTRALAGGHCAPHLVHSAAMLYMFLALVAPAGGGGMAGMGGSSGMGSLDAPTLAFVFALVLAGYVIWDLDQLSGGRTRGRLPAAATGRPAAALAGAAVAVSGAESPTAAFSGTAGTGGSDAGREPQPSGIGHEGRIPGESLRASLLSPGMTVACRIAMGATMAFMLLIMI